MSFDISTSAAGIYTPEKLWDRALEEADRAYDVMQPSPYFDGPFHTIPLCDDWSRHAKKYVKGEVGLFDQSATVRIMDWRPEPGTKQKYGILLHNFLSVCLTGLEPRIMDGTWQQFVPEEQRLDDLPRILSGSLESITETATAAGVDASLLSIWSLATELSYRGVPPGTAAVA